MADPKPLRYRLKVGEAATMDLTPAMSRVVDIVNASQSEVNQYDLARAVEKSQRHISDTGSPEVQVAVLTTRITRLAAHLKENHKDRHSHRGLMGLVNQRRKMMQYLKKKDLTRYSSLLKELNLRDNIK